jgi:hypothetical protein
MIDIKLVEHARVVEQLVNLFRVSFGRDRSIEHWEWKYLKNPLAAVAPEVIVAVDHDVIVGARPFFMTELWLGQTRIMAAEHADTMVHPGYRNQGIFNRMGKAAIEYLKNKRVDLSFGFPGEMSRPGFLHQGYRIVVPTVFLFRPIHTQKIITQRLNNKFLGRSIGFGYDHIFNPCHRLLPGTSGLSFELYEHATAALNELDALRRYSVIELVRSESYLRWRFDSHPDNSYRYVVAKKDGVFGGYAVISVQDQPNKERRGMLMDYVVRDGDADGLRSLVAECVNQIQQTGCDIIVTWDSGEPGFRQALTNYNGLKSSSGFPYNRFIGQGYMEALLLNNDLANQIDIYAAASWKVTYAYLDHA